MGALSGILVVALEQAVAAPLCTSRLAAAGARVIKIERAVGDFARGYDDVVQGESAYFVWLNHGKESLALNLKDEADRALLTAMIAKADVFVQNLAPGAAARAGFDSAALRAGHPRLITCDISGFGAEGPEWDRKAYDLLIQCEAGLAAISGSPEAAGRVGVSVADIACGMNSHAAILQALLEREKTGFGRGIAVSLFDGLADWMAVPLLHYDYAGKAPKRVGLNHPSIAPYGAFRCGDGREVVISIQNEREWDALCRKVLERPDLAEDTRYVGNVARVAHRAELEAEMTAILAGDSADGWSRKLSAAAIAYAKINEVSDLSAHPHLRRVSVETPSGTAQIPAPPAMWDGAQAVLGAVPAVDQHGAAIRREFAGA
jgi:itaconate CoA-transferase